MLFPFLVPLPGLLAWAVGPRAVGSRGVAPPPPAPAAAPAAAVASVAATATVAPTDPGAERRAGSVPPHLDPLHGDALPSPRGAGGLHFKPPPALLLGRLLPPGLAPLGVTRARECV